ncbi:hypothetical protein KEU06_09335 [Pseudaminobacter sp. 19-2017]|uniref:Uncharacterized protein n=1 Tax=Pseudaminobacter soli (ex Zhang et al. 2022) TaxID=2831468 RepID=A0A942E5F2_9HYPH|nr:hypothetical protein [Pseudaminobacter soli]MBS3648807.1 hypothetical protein [Pseudaminobacter soli]
MSKEPPFLDWDAIETEIADTNRKAWDAENTPEKIAARKAKSEAEFERGVRNGWWDKDGNSLQPEEPDEEEDEE